MKKLLFLFAAMLLGFPLLSQETDSFIEDMQYWKSGNYEIKLSPKNYKYAYYHGHLAGIQNVVTGKWVLEPIQKKSVGSWWVPRFEKTEPQAKYTPHEASAGIRFLDNYHPAFHGCVRIDEASQWDKDANYPSRAWFLFGLCGIFKIENDQLVPIIRGSKSVEDVYRMGYYYSYFTPIGKFPLIVGIYKKNGEKCYDIFDAQGKRLYTDVKSYKQNEDKTILTLVTAEDQTLLIDTDGKIEEAEEE
jgi:hypothetical protein